MAEEELDWRKVDDARRHLDDLLAELHGEVGVYAHALRAYRDLVAHALRPKLSASLSLSALQRAARGETEALEALRLSWRVLDGEQRARLRAAIRSTAPAARAAGYPGLPDSLG